MQLGFHTATCFIGTAWELGPRLEDAETSAMMAWVFPKPFE